MTQYLEIHPENPQLRLVRRAADCIREGGVIAYPTDSCYALGCRVGDRDALERVRRIRQADKNHHFTLVCRDLSEISRYARVETWQFRLLKACTPGAYTFLLAATKETPRMLLEELGEPLMSSTLLMPGDELPLTDGRAIEERIGAQLDAILDAGHCGIEPTTVVDLAASPPVIVRHGRGDLAPFA